MRPPSILIFVHSNTNSRLCQQSIQKSKYSKERWQRIKHQNKLNIAKAQGVKTALLSEFKQEKIYDVVVEATGSASGFETSMSLTKPRGVLVLKSTVASGKELNLAPIVIDEITVLGSRCGQFAPALRLLEKERPLKVGFLIVIAARSSAVKLKSTDIRLHLESAFTKLGMFKE